MNIAEIEAREQAASTGPWKVGTEPALNMVADCGETKSGQPQYVFAYHLAPSAADAEFIAHAREDISDLLAELKAAQEKLRNLAECTRCGGEPDHLGRCKECRHDD